MNNQKKGQGSIEMVVLIALALAVMLAIIALNSDVLTSSNKQFQYTKARTAVNEISNTAELVYKQGVGSRTKVFIDLPDNIEYFNLENKTVSLKFIDGDIVHRSLPFEVNGTLPLGDGNYWICITSEIGNLTMEECPGLLDVCGDNSVDVGEECDNGANNGVVCTPPYGGSCIYCSSSCTNVTIVDDIVPPASVTNLQNQSSDKDWIYWIWTNPVDVDYNQTIIYFDGINILNTTNNYYNATGLTCGTSHTITTNTMDTSGNINFTNVSSTAPTDYCLANIVFDTVSSATTGGATNTLSWSHTISGENNRLLIVGCAVEDGSSTQSDVSGISYNGQALTKANDIISGTSFFMNVELWYILNASLPTAGTYTVQVNTIGTSNDITCGGISLYNVSQVSPESTATNSDGQAGWNYINTQITTISEKAWIIDVVGSGNALTGFTPQSAQIERWDLVSGSSRGAGSTKLINNPGQNWINWTTDSSSNRIAHVLMSVAPAKLT